jgi:hypothetical protein
MPTIGLAEPEHERGEAQAAAWLVIVPVVAAALVFYPIARNYFREDDFVNLYFLENYGLGRFLITVWADHALVTRNAIWWLVHLFAGVRPEPYFVLAFVTHLVAVGAVLTAFRKLSGSRAAACAMAVLWGTDPVHQEAIGWFSVYGELVATIIVAWILGKLAEVRDGRPAGVGTLSGCGALVLVVATSFGVGLGVALGLPVVAALLLPGARGRTRVVLLFCAMTVAAFLLYWGLIDLSWRLFGPFPHLPITAALRVPRALLKLFALLAGNGIVSLLAGPFVRHVVAAPSAWWTIVGVWVATVAVALVCASTSERRVILAGVALAAACYVAFAGGRAPYYAQGIPFEQEARYQYTATVGLALATTAVLTWAGARVRLAARSVTGAVLAFAVLLVVGVIRFRPPINDHGRERHETEAVIAAIRAEIASAPRGADAYLENRPFMAVGPVIATAGMPSFPGWAAVFAIFFPDDTVDSRRVHFVSDAPIVQAGRQGRRSATLLVERP